MEGEIIISRIARQDVVTSFLHVMVQGVNKEFIFKNEKYIKYYLKIINEYKLEYNFTIIAYCIMNNHAHFLIHTKDIKDFGKFMQKVNLKYSTMYNKEEKRCGVLFRNRYKSEPISDIKYLINCIKYIHNNPVKAKMVDKCEDYEYSSYKDYVKDEGLAKSPIMNEIFGNNCDYKRMFENINDRKFMDIEKNTDEEIRQYILNGITDFENEYLVNTIEILSNRKIFRNLIQYLNENCGFKYIEIQRFFDVSKTTLTRIRHGEVTF